MDTTGMTARVFQRLAVIGLPLTVALNLVGLFVFHRHSSVFFSEAWWNAWFPNYFVWAMFGFIGAVTGISARRRS
jgi:hypothetical protein